MVKEIMQKEGLGG